jgi:DNA-binding NtrC family response regulator
MPRIMLVDDEPNVLSSLRRTIHQMPAHTFEGVVVLETFDQPELALKRAGECVFDLVISDWRMPTMKGITFLNDLVQLQPTIARLVLSAYGDFLSEIAAIERIRIFHFINKPWNNDDLRTLMRQALEQRRLESAGNHATDGVLRDKYRLTEIELKGIDQERPKPGQVKSAFQFQNRMGLCS